MDGQRPAAAPGSQADLVLRAAGGDVAAFARLIRLHHEAMTLAALAATGDLDRAVVATEAALLDAWLGLRRLVPPTDVEAWLCSRAVAEALRLARGTRLPDAEHRSRACEDVRIPPVDADALARRARAEEKLERQRRVSVAIGLVAGVLVAVHPYLLGLVTRR